MVASLMTVRMDAPPQESDFLVASIDVNGSPGNLNREALEVAGYSLADLPSPEELRSGYHRLQRDDLRPVLLVVTKGSEPAMELLRRNLHNGLLTCERDIVGRSVWLPLMGTGAGEMDFRQSYTITTEVINSLDFSGGAAPQFVLAIPRSENGIALMKYLESGAEEEEEVEEVEIDNATSYANRSKAQKKTGRAQRPQGTAPREPAYWIVSFHQPRWKTGEWKPGTPVVYRPKDSSDKAIYNPERVGMQADDRILGYVGGDRQELFGEFRVKSVAGTEMKEELIAQLEFIEKFDPPLPLHKFRAGVPGIDGIVGPSAPVEGVLSINTAVYTGVREHVDTPFVNNYIPYFLTEGNHKETEDQLDFKADIESFANVICLESVSPPLAIGLFGNWGSGKSFFMEKLEQRIAKLTRSGRKDLVEHVVPVRFNSWHYSDSNLWASMILQIFESLNAYATEGAGGGAVNAIYARLDSTRAQIAETQVKLSAKTAEVRAVESKKAAVAGKLKEKEATLALWTAKDIVKAVLDDEKVQERIDALSSTFPTGKLVRNVDDLQEQVEDMRKGWGETRAAWSYIMTHSRGKWLWVWIVALLVVIACFCASVIFRTEIERLIVFLTSGTAVLLAGIGTIRKQLRPAIAGARKYYAEAKSLIATVRQKKVAAEIKMENSRRELEAEIAALRSQREELEKTRQEGEVQLAQLLTELEEIRSGRRLADFVAARSADNAYLGQLGIVSRIRKDFEQLNDIFQEQREARRRALAEGTPLPAANARELQIDRIVLYIDDLDRCNEDVVVRVLEAIHLLLAFPLFVVVVGVDPRWLNNALTEKYKLLFGGAGPTGGRMPEGAATSYDYLEKIFQIPFALKPINKTGREQLLAYLVKNELEAGSKSADGQTAVGAASAEIPPAGMATGNVAPAQAGPGAQAASIPQVAGGLQLPGRQDAVEATIESGEKLVITHEELKFMQQIGPLFGHTPRTINRYVNIYRIIKAHGALRVQGKFERDESFPIMFVLAVIVGFADCAEEFLGKIMEARDDQPMIEFVAGCGMDDLRKAVTPELLGLLGGMAVRYVKQNVPLIARFSFRTLLKEEA